MLSVSVGWVAVRSGISPIVWGVSVPYAIGCSSIGNVSRMLRRYAVSIPDGRAREAQRRLLIDQLQTTLDHQGLAGRWHLIVLGHGWQPPALSIQ